MGEVANKKPYNEKYENIAPANHHQSDNMVKKQKLKQKSQQYRKQGMRSGKKETEAERLKRIAAERAKKPPVITVGDEITVGELASRLKMTAAEVIKKLFSLGMMASVNEVIDYDTAEIVATELGAKVNREVVVTIEERIIDDSKYIFVANTMRYRIDELSEIRSPINFVCDNRMFKLSRIMYANEEELFIDLKQTRKPTYIDEVKLCTGIPVGNGELYFGQALENGVVVMHNNQPMLRQFNGICRELEMRDYDLGVT